MRYNNIIFGCSDVTGNLKKYLRIHSISKRKVGVFFTKRRNSLRMGLISLGGAVKV